MGILKKHIWENNWINNWYKHNFYENQVREKKILTFLENPSLPVPSNKPCDWSFSLYDVTQKFISLFPIGLPLTDLHGFTLQEMICHSMDEMIWISGNRMVFHIASEERFLRDCPHFMNCGVPIVQKYEVEWEVLKGWNIYSYNTDHRIHKLSENSTTKVLHTFIQQFHASLTTELHNNWWKIWIKLYWIINISLM